MKRTGKLKTLDTALRIERQLEKVIEMSLLEIQAKIRKCHEAIAELEAEIENACQHCETEDTATLREAHYQHEVLMRKKIAEQRETIETLLLERGKVEKLKAEQQQKIEGLESLVEKMEQEITYEMNRQQSLDLMDSYLRNLKS